MTFSQPNDVRRLNKDLSSVDEHGDFQPGQILGDRYEVICPIGLGGMGHVYRVRQILVNKELALKTIDRSSMSETAFRRFQQEARTAFSLNHQNVIRVTDFGLLEDQTPFLVMELVNGENLSERIKRAGTLSWKEAIPIFVQVCFGLAHAHESGVVHRDIKPSNIMLLDGIPLGAEGSVKIVDFGIAKCKSHEGGEIQALTRTGEIFGSPLYMSPEQCNGLAVDHRSDIYSLGCVLFEALTGTPPFIGDNALSTMMKHLGEPAPTLKEASLGNDFPPAIEEIVATMLAKSPNERYQNTANIAYDLGALKNSSEAVAQGARKVKGASRRKRKHRLNECDKILQPAHRCRGVTTGTIGSNWLWNSDFFQTNSTAASSISSQSTEKSNLRSNDYLRAPDRRKSVHGG